MSAKWYCRLLCTRLIHVRSGGWSIEADGGLMHSPQRNSQLIQNPTPSATEILMRVIFTVARII